MYKNFIDELIARGVIVVNNKPVHVREYYRDRLMKREHVREHWRSLPRGKSWFL